MTELSPIVSEFETVEQAQAYDRWLRAKVAESLEDAGAAVSHDEAVARVRTVIAEKRDAAARLAR